MNGDDQYSYTCNIEKYIPKIIVTIRLVEVIFQLPEHIDACDQVTDTPDVRRIIVFKRGMLSGLKVVIFIGGHDIPNSWLGESLWWKNLQKKLIKNIISDVMNRIIPYFIDTITVEVWFPWRVLSRWISFHHENIVNMISIRDVIIGRENFVLKNNSDIHV